MFSQDLVTCTLYYYFITKTEKPGKPGKPDFSDIKGTSVVVNWKAPDSDGGSPITNYIVEYRPEGKTRWVKASEGKSVPDTTFKVRI